MDFTEFNLHEDLLKGIAQAGYVSCTPVQEQVLKTALDGADLYVQSQTGTGKTAAYLVAVLQEMLVRDDMKGKQALIMAPTRELAVQIEQEAKTLCSGTPFKTGSFYGGVGYTRQAELLKKHVDIIIGTPGRVIDLQESRTMDLSNVGFLVIDEADRMFDMGFYPDLRRLIKVLPPAGVRQTMLFSATLNTYVKNLAWEYTEDAKEITIEAEQVTVEEIDQLLFHVASDCKMRLLLGIIRDEQPESLLVFCNTKRSCEVIAKRLLMNGIEAEYIIGDLPQAKRLQVLDSFKRGSLKCLVATDVAARGIDVNDLAMVINYDLPNEPENYVHRIGRTARAGKSGKAYTFCCEQDVYNLPAIERYIEMRIPSTMADEEQYGEDKSSGVYIKLDSHSDEYYHQRGERNRNGKEDVPRERRRSKPRRGEGRVSQRGGKRGGRESRAELEDLAALPFEERMKRYREKFASEQQSAPQSGSEKQTGTPRCRQGAAAQKNRQNGAQGRRRNGAAVQQPGAPQRPERAPQSAARQQAASQKSAAEQRPVSAPVEQKKGLFARLKSFFTGA